MSRAELSVATGLTKPAVSSIVEALISDGYISEREDARSGAPGRRPIALEVDTSHHFIISISWGRSSVIAALINLDGVVVESKSSDVSSIDTVTAVIRQFRMRADDDGMNILGICVILPALILSEPVLIHSTVIEGLSNGGHREIAAIKEAAGDIPVGFFNDTACMSYEYKNEAGSDWLYVNISDGIGAVAYHGGLMFKGAGGAGLQFGHFSVDRNGPECSCGNKGCLELMVGGLAFAWRYREFGFDAPLSFDELSLHIEKKDPRAMSLVAKFADEFAFALSSLIVMHSPEEIYLGGRARLFGQPFLSMVRSNLLRCGFREFNHRVSVYFTREEKPDAIYTGAARYFIDSYHSFLNPHRNETYFG